MWLRPLPVTRIANCAPAAIATAFACAGGIEIGGLVGAGVVALAGLVGLMLCVRAYRMGVHCEGAQATLYGQFRTVVIRREQVQRISDFPVIHWNDAAESDAGRQ